MSGVTPHSSLAPSYRRGHSMGVLSPPTPPKLPFPLDDDVLFIRFHCRLGQAAPLPWAIFRGSIVARSTFILILILLQVEPGLLIEI